MLGSQRKGRVGANASVLLNHRSEVIDPISGVLVTRPPLERAVVIEFEMVVRIDEPWQHECPVQVDDGVARLWRATERANHRGKAD